MNIRISYMLAAVLSVAGAIAMAPAFALEPACPGCGDADVSRTASQSLLDEVPVSVWTDADTYDHESTIMVEGMVASANKDFPITITVISPTNNIVTIDQVDVNDDGTYMTTLNTAGNLWKYDGTYTIRVQYGSHDVNNKVQVELVGGQASKQTMEPARDCTDNELAIDDQCIPFSITGGSVTDGYIKPGESIVVMISSTEPGMLTLSPAQGVFRDLEFTFVDGEEWEEVTVDGNNIKIDFPAGTEEIEILGKFVIPEFGTIAALILAAAIVSIIAVSARSRLSIIPKY